MSQDIWVDYLEGEMSPAVNREMKKSLENSAAHAEAVGALQKTKELVQSAERKNFNLGEDFFEGLHQKIMAQVERTEIKKNPRYRLKVHHRRWVAVTSATLSLSLVLMLAFNFYNRILGHAAPPNLTASDQIIRQALESPDSFAELVSSQSQNDFFVDVASESFDDLSIAQFDRLMGSKGTR